MVEEIFSRNIITKSNLPHADYVINPYVGCTFGCSYCYASFMGRFVGKPIEDWGDYLLPKMNAVSVFSKDLKRLGRTLDHATLLMSSVTDAWQPAEKRYELSRGILAEMARARFKGRLSILTKSPLIVRDIDLLREIPNVEIGLTITLWDQASRRMERLAPNLGSRLTTLERINAAGLRTYAFIGPINLNLATEPEQIRAVVQGVHDAGTTEIYVEHLNTSAYLRRRMEEALGPDLLPALPDEDAAKSAIETSFMSLISEFGLHLRLGRVLDHRRDQRRASSGGKRTEKPWDSV